ARLMPCVPVLSSLNADSRILISFPTRRSSDLANHLFCRRAMPFQRHSERTMAPGADLGGLCSRTMPGMFHQFLHPSENQLHAQLDRKSTRLNSSHVKISYAVFSLKKKTR